jgi:hypothetical protein
MGWLIFAVLFVVAAVLLPRLVERSGRPAMPPAVVGGLRAFLILLAVLSIFATSFVYIDSDKVGHLKRIYGSSMPSNRVIATNWQAGPQAETIPPGFHARLFVRVIYDIEQLDTVEVAPDMLVVITARDGRPLPEGQYLADEWPEAEISKYLDAEYFMGADRDDAEPRGQRGPQLTVLKPGTYRLNRYLFDVGDPALATEIHAGFVGVVKSNVGQRYEGDPLVPRSIIESYLEASQLEVEHQRARLTKLLELAKQQEKAGAREAARLAPRASVTPDAPVEAVPVVDAPPDVPAPAAIQAELDALRVITPEEAKKLALTNLSNPLVPRGSIGVWQEVLLPGKFYLNPLAFTITHMDTRVQTWRYEGGYTRRFFNLEVGPDGAISQAIVEEPIAKPEGAADEAIIHKVEGWDVWLESRVLVQVTPDNAPFVVAYVGELREVEDRIITPMYRSVSRNILGTRDVKVLDVLYERQAMEEAVENAIKPEGLKTGLIIREVRFGDPYVPPELLIPGKRMQLARQMLETFDQEKKAQESRVEVERKKAEADQQSVLIAAQIKRQADEQLGIGSKNRLENEAEGQRAQVAVLGADKTLELAMLREQLSILRELLPVLAEHPELVKVPTVLVQGDKGGLAGAAAILGNSTLGQALGNLGR